MALTLAASATLLIGCETTVSETPVYTVQPDLYRYSAEFQALAAGELDLLPPPCDRVEPVAPCSATARLVVDYGDVRQQIRAAKE